MTTNSQVHKLYVKILYYALLSFCYLFSLLPFWILYRISDVLYFILYYLIGYRKKVVYENLTRSFPKKNLKELKKIEKQFYAFLCDYLVETVKLLTISDKNLNKRMRFEGVHEMVNMLDKEEKQFGFLYLGHYCNWEWIASLGVRIHEIDKSVICGQVYHPLSNKAFDMLMLKIRSKSQGINIPMKETLRYIINWYKNRNRVIIGFISDQSPKWSSTHHWCDFFNQKTAAFIGTEKMGRQVDALIFFGNVRRVRRGHYVCNISRMINDIKKFKEFEVTDLYFRLLEECIAKQPSYWLWTHKRWKRTYEEYLRMQEEKRIR